MSATQLEERLSALAEWQRRLRELSELQVRLRADVKQQQVIVWQASSAGEFARKLKVQWQEVDRFLFKGRPCGGRLLERIGKFGQFAEICARIKQLAAGVPDRVRVLAACSSEVIDLALELHEAHLRCEPPCSQAAFAAAFTPSWQDTVAGVLNFSEQAFRALEGGIKREALRALLASGAWRTQLETILRDQQNAQVLMQTELERLVVQLLATYKLRRRLAKALNVHRTTLTLALKGEAGLETLGQLLERARQLAEAAGKPTRVLPTDASQPARQELEQLGGETSPLGVRFVLGPQSFQEIEGDPGDEGVAYIKRSIELTRLLLNLCAQLKDEAVRGKVREALLREVEELQLAVRLFTVHFPNQLTALHQDQRLTWFRRVNQSGQQPKPKRR